MLDENNKKTDPVCGMYLDEMPDLTKYPYNGKDYLFCGEGCAKRFRETPDRFLGQPLIKIRNLHKNFGQDNAGTQALKGVDLNIWDGDFVVIIGASGSGKSTLLNLIGLLDTPSDGTILLDGRNVNTFNSEEKAAIRARTFGFVFQQYNLIPWLSVYDNITLPVFFTGDSSRLDPVAIRKMTDQAGISHRLAHRPYELSGGEQQRTALLRALVNNPEVIIGDEPTGNLDSKTGGEILNMLIDLHNKQKKTLIIVTHDSAIADKAEEVIVIKDGKTLRDQRIHQKIYAD